MSRQWWCNADFDLTLAHGGGKMPAKILESARNMAWHFWPALAREDSLLVPAAPPDGFLEYLRSLDLSPPRFTTEADPAASFTPFGWNEEAIRRNGSYRHPSVHPDFAAVRRVNSRAYSLELEHELFDEDAGDGCPAVFCATRAAVRSWLGGDGLPAFGNGRFVAKGNHGHAGIGQLRFGLSSQPGASKDVSSKLERLAARHGGLVIEPELEVAREWGVHFEVDEDGRVAGRRHHRLLSGASGGYAGALVLPRGAGDAAWAAYRLPAGEAVRRIAAELHGAGYFGPVGIDIFTHQSAEGLRLRRLVDLNARHSMALPAHGLARRFPEKSILLRQFSTTALRCPHDYNELRKLCDTLSFDSGARRGMIWLTPLLNLARVSVAFIGENETDVITMQDELMKRCAVRS